MTSLPGSYVTGVVVFSAVVSIGDVNGNAVVDSRQANGEVHFYPETTVYRSMSTPVVVVGHEVLSAKVVDGVLINAAGQPWYSLPTGQWRVKFAVKGVPLTSISIDVQTVHTFAEPLDLGALLPFKDTWGQGIPATDIAITDTGDGGYELETQSFEYADGGQGELVVTDMGDGGFEVTAG